MWAHVNPRSPGEHGKRLEVVGLWAADLQRTHQQGVGLRQDHPPSLILQLLFRFLFFFWGVGWSNLLIFTDFQLPLPFPFLLSSPSTPLSLSLPNLRAAPPLKPLVLSKAVSCAVWEGLEGNGGEKRGHYWKVAGTHHTLVIGFCRHRFGVGLDSSFRWKAVAEMHGWDN